ncbi:pyridoxal-dependent decarboxylase, exosortase A system-associated [Croceicoccus sp. F390]|uniref:Pyridoxal-dependent decarboxylase, exosortase A system-associated n=1 Tax=Croceicoccus esteveae TaxID=3075597 RepID=A0ABU2ZN94_9SPHN|nr:pyridoxal-dependent decarboxylase, exosortase A system-associated [Croceicoccus sp. F390]MDT0576902.1 pyridoxal-dependent decarboxylase, exosortase A system-associated [Croceicoccus sp. F390]
MTNLGPIPPDFVSRDGELCIGGKTASHVVAEAGRTPLFAYDMAVVERRLRELRAVMPQRLAIHYALKANPFAPLLRHMRGLVDGFDVASGGELAAALNAGMDAACISFAGPGKDDAELAAAIEAGVTINLESHNEARRAIAIAGKLAIRPRLAVRVNPAFDLRGSGMKMGGGARQFGVDAPLVPALVQEIIGSGAEWRGYHVYAGSQSLDAAAIVDAQSATLDMVAGLAEATKAPVPHCNLGGGFGIPYFSGDASLNIATIGAALRRQLSQLNNALRDTSFAIELGRWLVGEAGVYLTRVIDVKSSHGETFVITDGGLHHQLAASGNFGTVVKRNYPLAIANKFGAATASDPQHIVGRLCTPLDRLAHKAMLPLVAVGDLVAVFCAGAYGATASPENFLGHGPAVELLV